MQVLGSRRGGVITLSVAAAALLVAVAFAVWQLVERPSVTGPVPAPGSATASARPTVAFDVPDGARLGDLHVAVDGRESTGAARGSGGRISIAPGALKDGSHSVEVRFTTSNVFARTVTRRWSFTVDTAAPRLAVTAPSAGGLRARRAVKFTGTSEPSSEVKIAFTGGVAGTLARPDGTWTAVAKLPEGQSTATVTATDAAGNRTERRRRVVVDTTAPQLALSSPAGGAQLTDTDQPLVYGSIPSDSPRNLTFSAAVNGHTVITAKGSDAVSPQDIATDYGQASASSTATPLEVDGHRFALSVGTLPQGRNRITVSARDRAGNLARTSTLVSVNSTEEFGAVDLDAGAKGADVVSLQKRLREAKVYPKKAKLTGVLDPTTAKSVSRYQKRYSLPITGVVDGRTRSAMIGRIVVNLGQRKLRLIRNGRIWKTFSIAVGQPAYPTPTGEYEINDKQVDPVWYPPNSPWAAELSSIPAGPGNPLGTRWIGTTAPAIGIHGTYADSSIGYAASHGCMRMHIPDVETLYDQVAIGMKVSIRP